MQTELREVTLADLERQGAAIDFDIERYLPIAMEKAHRFWSPQIKQVERL